MPYVATIEVLVDVSRFVNIDLLSQGLYYVTLRVEGNNGEKGVPYDLQCSRVAGQEDHGSGVKGDITRDKRIRSRSFYVQYIEQCEDIKELCRFTLNLDAETAVSRTSELDLLVVAELYHLPKKDVERETIFSAVTKNGNGEEDTCIEYDAKTSRLIRKALSNNASSVPLKGSTLDLNTMKETFADGDVRAMKRVDLPVDPAKYERVTVKKIPITSPLTPHIEYLPVVFDEGLYFCKLDTLVGSSLVGISYKQRTSLYLYGLDSTEVGSFAAPPTSRTTGSNAAEREGAWEVTSQTSAFQQESHMNPSLNSADPPTSSSVPQEQVSPAPEVVPPLSLSALSSADPHASSGGSESRRSTASLKRDKKEKKERKEKKGSTGSASGDGGDRAGELYRVLASYLCLAFYGLEKWLEDGTPLEALELEEDKLRVERRRVMRQTPRPTPRTSAAPTPRDAPSAPPTVRSGSSDGDATGQGEGELSLRHLLQLKEEEVLQRDSVGLAEVSLDDVCDEESSHHRATSAENYLNPQLILSRNYTTVFASIDQVVESGRAHVLLNYLDRKDEEQCCADLHDVQRSTIYALCGGDSPLKRGLTASLLDPEFGGSILEQDELLSSLSVAIKVLWDCKVSKAESHIMLRVDEVRAREGFFSTMHQFALRYVDPRGAHDGLLDVASAGDDASVASASGVGGGGGGGGGGDRTARSSAGTSTSVGSKIKKNTPLDHHYFNYERRTHIRINELKPEIDCSSQVLLNRRKSQAAKLAADAIALANRSAAVGSARYGADLTVFVHGWKGRSSDLSLFKNYLNVYLPPGREYYCVKNMEEKPNASIKVLGEVVAQEVADYIASRDFDIERLSFVGHSMGCVVIRACLLSKLMQPFLPKLHTFVSLAGPHLGIVNQDSVRVGCAVGLLSTVKSMSNIRELHLETVFLHALSASDKIHMFRHVLMFGSEGDEFVGPGSALVCQDLNRDPSSVPLIPTPQRAKPLETAPMGEEDSSARAASEAGAGSERPTKAVTKNGTSRKDAIVDDMRRNISASGLRCETHRRFLVSFAPHGRKELTSWFDRVIGKSVHVSFLIDVSFINIVINAFKEYFD